MGRRVAAWEKKINEAWASGLAAGLARRSTDLLGRHERALAQIAAAADMDLGLLVRATLDQALGEGIPQGIASISGTMVR